MFDAIMTIGGALFLTKFWSIWRYGYFDFLCAAAAIACAFAAPLLMEKFAPSLAELGIFGAEFRSALIGCLFYDAVAFGRR